MKVYYFCTKEIFDQFGYTEEAQDNRHGWLSNSNRIFIYPFCNTSLSINPRNLNKIKNNFRIKSIALIDRVYNQKNTISAVDHINRTGVSYLRGNTPFEELPTFPDVSRIYSSKKGKIFMSIGKRNPLNIPTRKGVILSQWLAPISSVWHYLGVEISSFGVSKNITSIKEF